MLKFWARTVAVAAIPMLAACQTQAPSGGREELPSPTAVKAYFNSRLQRPVSGTFYVSYIPADFTEPHDVRVARDLFIRNRIIALLEEAGLKYTPSLGDAEFEVTYAYFATRSTYPLGAGISRAGAVDMRTAEGFSQNFTISVSKNVAGPDFVGRELPNDPSTLLVWRGDANVPCWPSGDCAELFVPFIHALLDNFPHESSTPQ